MKRWLRILTVGLIGLMLAGPSVAGTIALEGSDATSLHGDTTYSGQLFSFLKTDSYNATLPVLVWNNDGTSTIAGVPGDTVYATSLAAYPTLVGVFSGVYIQSPGTCCSENEVTDAGEIAKINALIAAGGSLAIQDYQGGNSAILGFSPGSSNVAGYLSGGAASPGAGGSSCFDSEIFLPSALAKGFTQPGYLGCWGHQAYNLDYFSTLGFISLVDSGPEFDGIGTGNWSSFLALGGALGTAPEPSVLLLLAIGLLGLGIGARRNA